MLPVKKECCAKLFSEDVHRQSPPLALPAVVHNNRIVNKPDFESTLPDSQAKVLIFAVQKKILIKPSKLTQQIRAGNLAGSQYAGDIPRKEAEVCGSVPMPRVSG